jgi:hypothetical protein
MRLSRTDWKYLVDTLMFLSLLGIVAIGLLVAFVIPEGPAELGGSKYFLGLHRHQWGDIHLALSLAFSAFALVHILLAWSWIKGKAAAVFGRAWKAALVLTVLAAFAVPGVFWLAATKNDPAFAEFGTGRGRGALRSGALDHRPQEPPPVAPSDVPAAPAGEPALTVAPSTEPAKEAPAEGHEERTVAGRMEAGTAEVVITGRMTLREAERATGIPFGDIAARLGLPAGVSPDETIGRLRRTYGFDMQAVRDAVAELLEEKRRGPAG